MLTQSFLYTDSVKHSESFVRGTKRKSFRGEAKQQETADSSPDDRSRSLNYSLYTLTIHSFIMSVITATSQRAPVTFRDYDQQYSVAIQDVPPRRGSAASVSSYTSNYSSSTYSSTPPTVYSPTSPKPAYRVFKQQTAAAQQPPPTPTIPPSFLTLPRQPNEPAIKCLPPAVYDCILRQLQDLHEAPENYQYGCTTCFQRDLHALALTSRTWERNVRSKLYVSHHTTLWTIPC